MLTSNLGPERDANIKIPFLKNQEVLNRAER